MKFPDKRLLLAAALGLPVMLTSCQSRAEVISSSSADSPNRTVTSAAGSDDESADEGVDHRTDADHPAAGSRTGIQQVALEQTAGSGPRAILEAAGAVIECDRQGRAVGIDLTEAWITPRVSRSVAELGDLQWADLRGTRVTDADVAVICALPQFELIALDQTRISDAGLRHLQQQTRLRFLSLDGTAVTDAGLSSLGGLPRLEGVSLADTAVTQAAAREFEARNPACRVILHEDAPETSSPQPTLPQESPLAQKPDGAPAQQLADLPADAFAWSQPDAASVPTPEPRQRTVRETLESIDFSEPIPETQQRTAEPRSTALPAPGEPTADAIPDATWFLDETKAAVFPQPLPQTSLTQSPGEQPQVREKPGQPEPESPAAVQPQFAPSTPRSHGQAQQTPVQITPQIATQVQVPGGDADETARQLNQVLKQRLLDPEVLTVLSRHLLAQQEYAKAVRALEALATLQPDDPQVRFDLGVAMARNGNYDQAHPHLASVVGDATAWYNLGVIAFERDQPQHSERYFGRAIDLEPDFPEARAWLTRVRASSSTTVSPTVQTPQQVDSQDLVDLLISEFGHVGTGTAAGTSPALHRSAAGITIAPKKSK